MRYAINPDEFGSNPLSDLRIMVGFTKNIETSMRVKIDEPGTNDVVLSVDNFFSGVIVEIYAPPPFYFQCVVGNEYRTSELR